MNLLGRILRGGNRADAALEKANKLRGAGRFGEAKLQFERAKELYGDDGPGRAAAEEAILVCRDGIARQRLDQAKQDLAGNNPAHAKEEILGGMEVAASESVLAELRDLLDAVQGAEAVTAAAPTEVSAEEELLLLIGSWEDEQSAEYTDYGDAIEQAVLLLNRGEAAEALEALKEIFERAEAPRYLWLELGRAHLHLAMSDAPATPYRSPEPSDNHLADAEEALRTFLGLLADDEGSDTRLQAHRLLAHMALEAGKGEEAVEEMELAAQALPDDPRPFLELGHILRTLERPKEAVEVLQLAIEGVEGGAPWQLSAELGLSLEACGEQEHAIAVLEDVIEVFAERRLFDFPPGVAEPLARLHEQGENHQRAADLYRALANGSNKTRHIHYYFDAGRVLTELNMAEEARDMLSRAEALAQQHSSQADQTENARAPRPTLEQIRALLANIEPEDQGPDR